MQILLIKSESEIRNLITFLLEGQFAAIVEPFNDEQSALARLLEDTPVNLIICDDDDKNSKLFKYLLNSGSKIPCIGIQKSNADGTLVPGVSAHPAAASGESSGRTYKDLFYGFIGGLKQSDLLKELVANGIQKGLINTQPDSVESIDYIKVKPELLLRVFPLKSDIYVRLSTIKFVKLFEQGDTFDARDLEMVVLRKKIDTLYIAKTESAEFITKISADLNKLASRTGLPASQAVTEANAAHELASELMQRLGFTSEIQEIAKSGIRLTLQSIGTSPKLGNILRLLSRDKDKYISNHSMMLAQIACGLSALMQWPSGSTFQKLTFAAFLHDILFSNQALAQIKGLDELKAKSAQFTPIEIKLFNDHPHLVAEIARNFGEIPPDVDQILLQHHEKADGSGFPRKLSGTTIHPLSAVFIVAHEFVDFCFDQADNAEVDIEAFLKSCEGRFTTGTFRKIMETWKTTSVPS